MRKYILILFLTIIYSVVSAQVINTQPKNVNCAKIETGSSTTTTPNTTLVTPPDLQATKRTENTLGASANNNCTSPTLLTVGGSCVSYSNASNSDIGNSPTCMNTSDCPL